MRKFKKLLILLIVPIICSVILPGISLNKQSETISQPEPTEYIPTPAPIQKIEIIVPVEKKTITTEFNDDPQKIWNMISQFSPNDYFTAAVMGMISRESQFKSNAVTGWYMCSCKTESELFTARIDKGLSTGKTRDDFVYTAHSTYGGYGLVQWYSWDFLWSLYDYAQAWGTSIGDAEMQISYIFWYIRTNNHYNLWDKLTTATSAYDAGDNIAIYYEGTCHHSYVASLAQKYYDTYAQTGG